ncbi:MAG: ribose 5-phosphate isomerase A [Puia sp.]|nr:ribose 5-phosphate isomerase A [Puia sp.]
MSIDLKKEAAIEAVKLIKDGSTIGLGAGSTIKHIVDLLKERIIADGFSVKVLTSSFTTRQLLIESGIDTPDLASGLRPELYLDGCDQVDKDLNALKSGGGIHMHEKLLASLSDRFVIIGDESKYTERFSERYPLVIEVIPEALYYVPAQIRKLYNGSRLVLRTHERTDGAVITRNGNYLFDIWFQQWPSPAEVNPLCKAIPGILETSLFYGLAEQAILAGENGIRVLEKKEKKKAVAGKS